jgi:hypothetical protein
MAPGKGLEPLRAKGPLACLPIWHGPFCANFGSRGQRDNHSATPAFIKGLRFVAKNVSVQQAKLKDWNLGD